jgi:hypothetical protein
MVLSKGPNIVIEIMNKPCLSLKQDLISPGDGAVEECIGACTL